jgi:CTP synthase (UTP-ammonia lyase)
MENTVAIEAVREMTNKENVKIIMYAPVPYLKAPGELKTKPVQHATREAMRLGIQPDALCLFCDKELSDSEINKIVLYTGVAKKNIVWHTNGIEECSKKLTKIIFGEVKEFEPEPYINAPMMELE